MNNDAISFDNLNVRLRNCFFGSLCAFGSFRLSNLPFIFSALGTFSPGSLSA
jgi:hypothetical protein